MKLSYRKEYGGIISDASTGRILTNLTKEDAMWLFMREDELEKKAKPTRVYKTNRLKSDHINWS